MKKYRIYPIIILAILLLSIYLPNIYKDMFASRIDNTRIHYSVVDEDFIKMTVKRGQKREVIYSNLKGTKTFTQDEYKAKLPFIYYSDLLKTNNFPKKFINYGRDPRIIAMEKSYIKLKPSMINTKLVNLYPLLESKPKYSRLQLPKDLFKLDENGITFIISASNSIDKEKTKLYNSIFLEQGAVFPLKEAFGTPSTMKPFDEGYFVSDSKNQLFHLKQINNKPFIKKLPTNDLKIKFVLNKEDKRKEYYGLVIDEKSDVYLLMYDEYELVKLPIKDFNYKKHTIKIATNPINRVITLEHIDYEKQEKIIKTYITNLDYEIKKENLFSYSLKQTDLYEEAKKIIFPYKLYLVKGKQSFITFEFRDLSLKSFVIFSMIALLFLLYIKLSKRKISDHFIQTILIALSGIYAIIILILFDKLFLTKPIKKEKNEHD